MEALILRRNYPVPVTFADLRRARENIAAQHLRVHLAMSTTWHTALKSATGATDDVYVVTDGRDRHLASTSRDEVFMGTTILDRRVGDLMIKADEQGYWERPHEVRLDLQERVPTVKAIDAVVQRSLIEAEVRRGH